MGSVKQMSELQNKKVLDFFAEAGLLKRVKRTGWWVVGIKDAETVAEHCFRCAVIGYVLAEMENVSAEKVVMMCLFHDFAEARINDAHKMGAYYINYRDAETRAFLGQIKNLPKKIKNKLLALNNTYLQRKTKESIVARDADILECLLQAKEYYGQGHSQAKLFFKKAPQFLKSKNAKKLWNDALSWDTSLWWQNLVNFEP